MEEFLGRNVVQILDELIINLVGLRTEFYLLDEKTLSEILERAKKDLVLVAEGLIKHVCR